jgi:hypothetical protein
MEKLTLSIEDLVVASFETDTPDEPRGTVAGHEMISGNAFTCRTCLTNITCCTPMA